MNFKNPNSRFRKWNFDYFESKENEFTEIRHPSPKKNLIKNIPFLVKLQKASESKQTFLFKAGQFHCKRSDPDFIKAGL